MRQVGATPKEIGQFEMLLRQQSRADPGSWWNSLQSASPSFFTDFLTALRIQEREAVREFVPRALFPDATPVRSCESLRETPIADTTIDVATIDARDQSCRVTATIVHPPANNPIRIFIALPMSGWNGRFNGTGGGGYAGGSLYNLDSPDSRVAKGYAVATTDTGNAGGTAAFALDANGKQDWPRLRENAYLGIHDMTVIGKTLTRAFYGKAPGYAYFVGGSTGGRQALTEAQRYPQDYDGILSLNPSIAQDRSVPAQLWPQILMHEANDFLPMEKREVATAAAIEACDGADGVLDGIIDDLMNCRYDPAVLIGREIGGSLFTATDARIIREIWEGPRGHDGRFLWWGPTPGTGLSTLADTGGSPLTGKPSAEGVDWFRYFLVLDPKWDWTTLTRSEFELLFEQSIQVHGSLYGGDDPNLGGFRDRGGKLLIVHGLADRIVPPQGSIAYYENVQRRMGGGERTAEFARLFLVPGVGHGLKGPGPSPTGMMDALIRWVEDDHAPRSLRAELSDEKGKALRTRLLFPYSQVTKDP